MHERRWSDIEPSEPILAAYDVSKKVISLRRNNQTVQREEDGAIQFYRIKFHLRNHSSQVQHWSNDRWKSDFSVPRRAKYVHSAWKKHQHAVFWVDINLAIKEGLTFYQTRSNAIIFQGTLPAYCIPKVVRLKTGEVLYERPYLSPRPPPKISLRHDHDWTRGNDELGSTVEQQPVGKFVQQPFGEVQHVKLSKPTQSKPKPICDRSGKPERLSEDILVKHVHDGSGQPDERNSSSAHTQ